LPLTPGCCLGVYEMIKPIGDGAMGQLFHAIRSWRDVAIKILPEAFSHDADGDAEFLAPEKDLAFQPMIPAGTERSRTSSVIWVNLPFEVVPA
jgi:hypothetical protein